MSSTILLPPRAQLCNRSCSNKHTHRRSVWDPETSKERGGDWGGPKTVWALFYVAERRATRPNGEWGYSTRRHMLGPDRPEAVLPERGVVLSDIHSHLLIVNKLLSLSLSD